MVDKMKDEEQKKVKLTFGQFMSERRTVDRWFVVKVGIVGMFAGALLMAAMNLIGLSWP